MRKITIETPKIKPEWTLLHEGSRENLDRLLDVYSIDKKKAKVLYCQRKADFFVTRVVLFEWPNGDFKMSNMTKRYGISKSNIIYHRETYNSSIIYSKKKFYKKDGKYNINQLTFNGLRQFLGTFNIYCKELESSAYQYMVGRLGWLRNVAENPNSHNITLNTIISKKLYSANTLLRYKYGVPLPAARILEANHNGYMASDFMKMWGEMKKHLINIENITPEFLNNELLKDTCLMAEALGEKINCAWSAKRLKLEHDKWGKQVTDIILEYEPLRNLKNSEIFKVFAKFGDYKLLTTNHELIAEGRRLNHCVGTYSNNVDTGICGIYSISGHTLDLRVSHIYSQTSEQKAKGQTKKLVISQYRGYSNDLAPTELMIELEAVVSAFNEEGIEKYL